MAIVFRRYQSSSLLLIVSTESTLNNFIKSSIDVAAMHNVLNQSSSQSCHIFDRNIYASTISIEFILLSMYLEQ